MFTQFGKQLGSFDGAESCELMGSYILHLITTKHGNNSRLLYFIRMPFSLAGTTVNFTNFMHACSTRARFMKNILHIFTFKLTHGINN